SPGPALHLRAFLPRRSLTQRRQRWKRFGIGDHQSHYRRSWWHRLGAERTGSRHNDSLYSTTSTCLTFHACKPDYPNLYSNPWYAAPSRATSGLRIAWIGAGISISPSRPLCKKACKKRPSERKGKIRGGMPPPK